MTVSEDDSSPTPGNNTSGAPEARAMSLTYSDFVYPLPDPEPQPNYGSSSSLHINNYGSLPTEFQVIQETSVPLLQNFDEEDQDFIVLAEFSEIEGPIPLCTIPNEAPERTNVDLNSLSVHLMSTDYQVNTVGQFGISEDTQVYRANVFTNVHVFMQYFTLFDLKARGFVRPFCFGYVSKDHVKLERKVKTLVQQFNDITRVLKHSNRLWFVSELEQYLKQLHAAKENFIYRTCYTGDEVEEEEVAIVFEYNEDSETITLNQIAHQFTEIENIVKIVRAVPADTNSISTLERLDRGCKRRPGSILDRLFNRLDFLGDSFASLCIPLIHPLKQKGESLRPITRLGQLGTVALARQLMTIYEEHRRDLIFTEMTVLTEDFQNHFKAGYQEERPKAPLVLLDITEEEEEVLCKILEKLHNSIPLVPQDNKSELYHSFSDESDVVIPNPRQATGVDIVGQTPSSYLSAMESQNGKASVNSTRSFSPPNSSSAVSSGNSPEKPSEPGSLSPERPGTSSPWTVLEPRLSTGSQGYSSDESGSPVRRISADSTPTDIPKVAWYNYAAKPRIQKRDPGYALLRFFQHFYKVAHHVVFSLLVGRPVVFCGGAKARSRVEQIVTALIPLVPSCPEKSFKVLPWHQGILVRDHLCSALIGLCIPERHTVHDLLNPRDQNSVTVLDVETKKLLGPYYSGNFLSNFEELTCQKYFFDDLSLIAYLGSIFSEVESQVFMFKAMQADGESVPRIMKQLDLKNSDAEIIKYLASRIERPEQSVDIF